MTPATELIEDVLEIPPGTFTAYLFDLDGTIADSMPLHYRSWMQAVEEAGGTFPEEMFYSLGGVTLPRTVEILNERLGYAMNPAAVARRKEISVPGTAAGAEARCGGEGGDRAGAAGGCYLR